MKFVSVTRNVYSGMKFLPTPRKFLPVIGHFCLIQEIPSYDKKYLPEKRNFFLWQEISSRDKKFLPATRNFFFWQEISALDKRFLPMPIVFFLWQLITCSAKKFLPVTRKYFLHVVCDRKNSFIWQEIRTFKSNLRQNSVNCCKNFVWVWRFRGSLAPRLPANIPPCCNHPPRV